MSQIERIKDKIKDLVEFKLEDDGTCLTPQNLLILAQTITELEKNDLLKKSFAPILQNTEWEKKDEHT